MKDKHHPILKTYGRLLGYVRPYWWIFLAAIFGNVLYAVIDSGFVKLLEPLLDEVFVARNATYITWTPIVIMIVFTFRGFASFLSTYCMGWVGRTVVTDIRRVLFNHILRLPVPYYDAHSSGELISKITYNVEQVAEASTEALSVLVREICTALGLIIVMLSVSPGLTLVFFATVPVMAFLMSWVNLRLRNVSTRIQNTMGDLTHVVQETIEGHKVVRSFGGEDYESRRFNLATKWNRQQEMKQITTSALSVPAVQLIGSAAMAATIYLATLERSFLMAEPLTPGAFTTFIVSMMLLLRPIRQLTKVNTKIQKGLAAAQSVFEMLDQPLEKDGGDRLIERATGDIRFESVSFQYPDGLMVLDQVSFAVKPGETVALVGRSGSGKTTLVNLLPRFYDRQDGRITLDGVDIEDYFLDDLRRQFAFVSQHVTLFNDTIRQNILYGTEQGDVTEARLMDAARAANGLEFIERLPEGFDTVIGENGLKLSGGQRQRLAIARAIIKDAPVLILDEATSALDTESERQIQEALERLRKNRTTIVIAHRLSTIEGADTIVVLEKGKLLEMGTHRELLAKGGTYATLRRLQYQSEDTEVLDTAWSG